MFYSTGACSAFHPSLTFAGHAHSGPNFGRVSVLPANIKKVEVLDIRRDDRMTLNALAYYGKA
jgi:hypothetical protein